MEFSSKTMKKYIFVVLASVILVAFVVFACDSRLDTVFYTLQSDKITAPVRIALVTDLHSCKYGDGQEELINAIDLQKPDIVLLGGDIVDDRLPQENAFILLRKLAEKYPCYYVSGNHEYCTEHIDDIKQSIRDLGITVLEGDCETVYVNGQYINICGVDDPAYIGLPETAGQIDAAYNAADKSLYTVLLIHRPEFVDIFEKYDFDLILSGHTHGGQWRIPGILNGLLVPGQGLFPKYAGGSYNLRSSVMIISRGLARETTVVPRIFDRPELVIVDLIPAEAQR